MTVDAAATAPSSADVQAALDFMLRKFEQAYKEHIRGHAVSPVPVMIQQEIAHLHFQSLLEQLTEQLGLDVDQVKARLAMKLRDRANELGPGIATPNGFPHSRR